MPDVPYIVAGATPTADEWNLLFAEFDRKIGIAMDGKGLLYLGSAIRIIFGNPKLFSTRPFIWGTNRVYSTYFSQQSYSHTPFTNAVAAVGPDNPTSYGNPKYFDVARKVLRLAPIPGTYYTQAGVPTGFPDSSNAPLLTWSLEAHRKLFTPPGGVQENYWVQDRYSFFPEKLYQTAMAELVFEDLGASFDFLGTWNKYNFFRIHNCQNIALTVNFKGSGGSTVFSVVVAAFGSQCVRRTGVDGTYTVGYNYFQKFIPGDFRYPSFGNNSDREVYSSSIANNVVNPLNVFNEFVRQFTGNVHPNWFGATCSGGHLVRDYSITPDALPDISGVGTYFPTSVGDGERLGDFLYHRGLLKRIPPTSVVPALTNVPFNGFATAATDFAAAGVTLGTHADGSPTVFHATEDLACYSSNLLITPPHGPVMAGAVRQSNTIQKIYAKAPGSSFTDPGVFGPPSLLTWFAYEMVMPYQILSINNGTVHYVDYAAETGIDVAFPEYIQRAVNPSDTNDRHAIPIHTKTIADLKNDFNLVGDPAFNSTNQITPCCTFANKSVAMTWGGLILKFDQKLSALYPPELLFHSMFLIRRMQKTPHLDFVNGFMVIKNKVHFTDYGWNHRNSGWCFPGLIYTPRAPIAYEPTARMRPNLDPTNIALIGTDRFKHPYSVDEPYGPDGVDVTIKKLGDFIDAGFRLMAPWGERIPITDTFFPVGWRPNTDILMGLWVNISHNFFYSGNRSRILNNTQGVEDGLNPPFSRRLTLSIEAYNSMALNVNQYVKAMPVNFLDNAMIRRPALTHEGTGFRVVDIKNEFMPKLTGIFYKWNAGATIRPKDQYTRFELAADIPFADQANYQIASMLGIPIKTIADFPASWANIISGVNRKTIFHALAGPSIQDDGGLIDIQSPFGAINGLSNPSLGPAPAAYLWCTWADVKSAATALGWKMVYSDMTMGYALKIYEATAVTYYDNTFPPFSTTPANTGIWANYAILEEVDDEADVEFVGEQRPYPFGMFGINPLSGAPKFFSSDAFVPLQGTDTYYCLQRFDSANSLGPDYLTGYNSNSSSHLHYKLDIDHRVRELKIGDSLSLYPKASYISAMPSFEGVTVALKRVLFRNFSTVGKNGFAIAFPRSTMTPDCHGFSSDLTHLEKKARNGGNIFQLTPMLVPLDPTGIDMSTFSLKIPVNRSGDIQLVEFADFTAPGFDRIQVRYLEDDFVAL